MSERRGLGPVDRRTRDVPFLHDYVPPPDALTGFVIEDQGWYWTGRQSPNGEWEWSRNARRALVDIAGPWSLLVRPVARGRCVEVLLEDEATMMPLYRWPRP